MMLRTCCSPVFDTTYLKLQLRTYTNASLKFAQNIDKNRAIPNIRHFRSQFMTSRRRIHHCCVCYRAQSTKFNMAHGSCGGRREAMEELKITPPPHLEPTSLEPTPKQPKDCHHHQHADLQRGPFHARETVVREPSAGRAVCQCASTIPAHHIAPPSESMDRHTPPAVSRPSGGNPRSRPSRASHSRPLRYRQPLLGAQPQSLPPEQAANSATVTPRYCPMRQGSSQKQGRGAELAPWLVNGQGPCLLLPGNSLSVPAPGGDPGRILGRRRRTNRGLVPDGLLGDERVPPRDGAGTMDGV
jgi:hypothetical protein